MECAQHDLSRSIWAHQGQPVEKKWKQIIDNREEKWLYFYLLEVIVYTHHKLQKFGINFEMRDERVVRDVEVKCSGDC